MSVAWTVAGRPARSTWRKFTSLLPDRSDWNAVKRDPKRDLMAGVTVAIVALPLALAFGVASGLGAQAGLATAVVAGAVAAIFGGSNLQVSGPTGAMTVVLVPVVAQFGGPGVMMVGVMAGVALIAMAIAGLGRYVRYLPAPVIEGFTAGIAVVIALQQVPVALGIDGLEGEKVWALAGQAVAEFATSPNPGPLVMSLAVAGAILLGARWRPAVPFSLIAVVIATLVAVFTPLEFAPLGDLPSGLPAPSLDFFDISAVGTLSTAAVAVAALAALESLLSATVADGMSVNERHNPDKELFGQGLANIAAPLFGGIPATAAIARTAVNVRAGASSKLAALTHAVVLLAVILVAATLVSEIPLAALAGVLFATTVRMVEFASLRAIARATRGDGVILLMTFAATVMIDLVTAVIIGIALAGLLALRAVARSARVERVPLEVGDYTDEEHALLSEHIVAYRLDGPLFFAAAHRFLLELSEIADVRVVILRMSRVTTLDATGAQVLGDAITRLEKRGIVVMLSGIKPRHDAVMSRLGVAEHLYGGDLVFADTPSAIERARALLRAERERETDTAVPDVP